MSISPALVWFRLDLRLSDHPALTAACERGGPVIPVYIDAPEEDGDWRPGGASKWWLHQSLASLGTSLNERGSRLIIRRGPSLAALRGLARETGAGAVYWSRRYEPAAMARDDEVQSALRADGMIVETHNSGLLFEPWTISNKSGRPFQVFTPFWRHCLSLEEPGKPLAVPRALAVPEKWPGSEKLASLGLEPRHDWAAGLRGSWRPGETGGLENLRQFCSRGFEDYGENRNRPDRAGTSRLSPHLHFGEIGPRQIWQQLKASVGRRAKSGTDWRRSQYLAEIGWREFAYHLLHHFPRTPTEPLRAEFVRFPWRENADWLRAWQRGRTGYPIVDAGMRELWTTGWMHNRVRMVVASFLVKDLLMDWREGARWFWDTLVDADLASNTLGWQWTAGCGADAAPFFRIFNPVSQGEKFDPNGDYVRRWVPELGRLPDRWIHRPWEAPETVLATAGVELDETYPSPIVSHALARNVALESLAKVRKRVEKG